MLKLLAFKPLTAIDLETEHNINLVQALTKLGYVRDYGMQYGHRIPIRLRIWGLTDAGRAVLREAALAANSRGQFSFTIDGAKESKESKKAERVKKDAAE
jgi:hypothetical protein